MENIVEVEASIDLIDILKNILKAFLHFVLLKTQRKHGKPVSRAIPRRLSCKILRGKRSHD